MTGLSGDQFEFSAGGYRAVVTESGATLRVLEYGGRPLVHGFGEDEMSSAGSGQLLMPWPNRIRDGAYTFDGRDLQLGLTEPARNNACSCREHDREHEEREWPGVRVYLPILCMIVLVVLFAALSFDPRLMWDAAGQRSAPIVVA